MEVSLAEQPLTVRQVRLNAEGGLRQAAHRPMRQVNALQSACEHGRGFSVGDNSYCVLQTSLSWHEARRRCGELGGQLAQFETRAEQRALERAVRSPMRAHAIWIGLSRGRGEWRWAQDNGPLRYDGWSHGEPNNAGGREQCGEWLGRNGLFNDLPCDQRRAVLCEAASGAAGTRGCGGERVNTEAGSYCLYDDERLSWEQAQKLCEEGGMQLASLQREGEAMQLAEALASGLRVDKLWIGLSDEAAEGQWRWSSGEAVAGEAGWGRNQPDNYNGEHCGEWRIGSRDWNDMRCDAPRGALCEF